MFHWTVDKGSPDYENQNLLSQIWSFNSYFMLTQKFTLAVTWFSQFYTFNLRFCSSYDKVKIQRSVKNAKYRNYLTYTAHALTETLKTFQRYQREEKDVVRVRHAFYSDRSVIFSCGHATLEGAMSIRPPVRPSVGPSVHGNRDEKSRN